MVKIEVIPYDRSYIGLCFGNPEIEVVRAKKVTTKGWIFKDVYEEDVWAIVDGAVHTTNVCGIVDIDYYWEVIKTFPVNHKGKAEKFVKSLKDYMD